MKILMISMKLFIFILLFQSLMNCTMDKSKDKLKNEKINTIKNTKFIFPEKSFLKVTYLSENRKIFAFKSGIYHNHFKYKNIDLNSRYICIKYDSVYNFIYFPAKKLFVKNGQVVKRGEELGIVDGKELFIGVTKNSEFIKNDKLIKLMPSN